VRAVVVGATGADGAIVSTIAENKREV